MVLRIQHPYLFLCYSKSELHNHDDNLKAQQYAQKLRNAGVLILTLGVGPYYDAGFLTDLSGENLPGSPGQYYDIGDFQDLTEQNAIDVGNRTCYYWPPRESEFLIRSFSSKD